MFKCGFAFLVLPLNARTLLDCIKVRMLQQGGGIRTPGENLNDREPRGMKSWASEWVRERTLWYEKLLSLSLSLSPDLIPFLPSSLPPCSLLPHSHAHSLHQVIRHYTYRLNLPCPYNFRVTSLPIKYQTLTSFVPLLSSRSVHTALHCAESFAGSKTRCAFSVLETQNELTLKNWFVFQDETRYTQK